MRVHLEFIRNGANLASIGAFLKGASSERPSEAETSLWYLEIKPMKPKNTETENICHLFVLHLRLAPLLTRYLL